MLNSEKMLAKIIEFVNTLPDAQRSLIMELYNKDLSSEYFAESNLVDVMLDCKRDIVAKANKSCGKSGAEKAARRIFDQVGKTFGSFEKDGCQYIGGKYMAVRLFEGKHIKADENKQDGDFTRYGTLIDGAKDKATKTINVPSLADLKLYEKMFKIEHENMYSRLEKVAVYMLDNYYPVNTKFLIDIITIIGEENLEIHVVDGSPVAPIYIRSEDGDAIILPIRLSEADRQVLAA